MERKLRLCSVLFAFALLWSAGTHAAQTDEPPMVTGEHWIKSSEQLKKAYLLGVANLMQVENAYGAANPSPDAHSIIARASRGLRGQTLDSVRDALDRWYAANPARLQRPVIETIWFEMVVPGLQKPK